jgi:hypothetical protein
VADTYLDMAVYAVIALGIHTYPGGRVPSTPPQPVILRNSARCLLCVTYEDTSLTEPET